jgi:hypothetical protein
VILFLYGTLLDARVLARWSGWDGGYHARTAAGADPGSLGATRRTARPCAAHRWLRAAQAAIETPALRYDSFIGPIHEDTEVEGVQPADCIEEQTRPAGPAGVAGVGLAHARMDGAAGVEVAAPHGVADLLGWCCGPPVPGASPPSRHTWLRRAGLPAGRGCGSHRCRSQSGPQRRHHPSR